MVAHTVFGRLLAVLVLAGPGAAGAYSVTVTGGQLSQVNRWNRSTVSWRMHVDCSADLPVAVCQAEVRASFDAWTGWPCSRLVLEEQPPGSNRRVTANGWAPNGVNEVVWVEDETWQFGSWVLANTTQSLGPTGLVEEVDIAFNGLHHTWTATAGDPPGALLIRNTAVHEIGHLLGLAHHLGPADPADPPTMAVTADPDNQSATLAADDVMGLCFLVPGDEFRCETSADCPDVVGWGPDGETVVAHFSCWSSGYCEGFTMAITGDPPPVGPEAGPEPSPDGGAPVAEDAPGWEDAGEVVSAPGVEAEMAVEAPVVAELVRVSVDAGRQPREWPEGVRGEGAAAGVSPGGHAEGAGCSAGGRSPPPGLPVAVLLGLCGVWGCLGRWRLVRAVCGGRRG